MNLFHYTDVSAVKSMLENKKIWLTDVRFLNDSTEMKEGFEILLAYVDHVADKYTDSEEFQAATSFVRQVVYQRESYGLDQRPVFLSSFSKMGDLLSQWRAYGSYAVEFDSTLLKHRLSNCVYDRSQKHQTAAVPVLSYLLTIGRSLNGNDGHLDDEGRKALSEFIGLAATLKNQSFSEEQEYRLVMGHDVDPSVDDGYQVKYRERGGLLIPYLELGFNLDCVRSITVGPMRDQELAFASMKAFVKKVCADELSKSPAYIGEIQVHRSLIPFRS